MGVVQVQLPGDLKQVIERQVAKGRASNEADFLAEAVRLFTPIIWKRRTRSPGWLTGLTPIWRPGAT